jgi:hypothetical protein
VPPSSSSPPLQLSQPQQQNPPPNNIKRDSFFHFGNSNSNKPDQDLSSKQLTPQISETPSDPSNDSTLNASQVHQEQKSRHRHQPSLTSISMPAIPLAASSGAKEGGKEGVWSKLGNRLAGRMKSTRIRSSGGGNGGRNFSSATTTTTIGEAD